MQALYDSSSEAVLRGRAAGLLTLRQAWDESLAAQKLSAEMRRGLLDAQALSEFLLGYLPVSRGLLLQSAALIESLSEVLLSWDDTLFLNALPGLRLAFTALKPRESAALAERIAADGEPLDVRQTLCWQAPELAKLGALRADVEQALRGWGLHVDER